MKFALKNILRSPYFILLLMVIVANWQLVFLQSGMEWDMMNFWMPWRHFMSECYNNGIVPLWDPYTQSGYPVHGDLQGPAYSPEAILVSFLFGQNIYILNYCFVFYLYVTAVGMYRLALFFTGRKEVSILAGIIYSMSGFNIAHGHYFYIMVSVALIPIIFYYFFKILNNGGYIDALKMSLVIFWHITTGNPSFLIISGYLMICIFLFYAVWKIRQKHGIAVVTTVKYFGVVGGLSLLMALPVIYNAIQIIPLTTRKDGLDLAYAGDESFYLQNFIAFVIPLITITNTDLTGYEQELWSPYIGAFTIFFFLLGLFTRKTFFEWALLFVGFAGLLVAIGLQGPLYPFLHKHLPFFNVFRMPNLSLIFFLIFAIILCARYLSDEDRVNKLFEKNIHWYFVGAWLLILGIMLYVARDHEKTVPGLFDNYEGLRKWIYEAKPSQVTLFHLYLFIATALVLVIGHFTIKNKPRLVMVVIVFDVFVNYQLGGVARIFSVESATEMNEYFSRFPKGFAPPAPLAMERVSGVSKEWPGYWLNTSVFNKQPDFPNSNNFELTTYLDLLLNKPRLSKNIFKNSFAFFADSLVKEETFIDSLLRTKRSTITLNENDLKKIAARTFNNSANSYETTEFLPNKMSYAVRNKMPAAFVVCQNYCPLWKFKLNGRPYSPAPACSGSFPVFFVPAGQWQITCEYDLPSFGSILLFSLSIFIIGLFVVVYYSVPRSLGKTIALFLIPIFFVFCLLKFYLADVSARAVKVRDACAEYLSKYADATYINNTSFDLGGSLQTNFVKNEDLARLQNMLDSVKTNEVKLLQFDRYFSKEAEELIAASFGPCIGHERIRQAKVLTFQRQNAVQLIKDTCVVLDQVLNEKNPYSGGILIDSVKAQNFKPGDLFSITGMIESSEFDFPGLSLEVHYSNAKEEGVYKYANVSYIRKPATAMPTLVYRLREHEGVIKKIVAYVWNSSWTDARVRTVRMRIYRP